MGNKSKRPRQITYWNMHPDYEWYISKVDWRGGSLEFNGRHIRIGYIGSTPKYKIMWYNTILYFKWLKRKLVRIFNKITNI